MTLPLRRGSPAFEVRALWSGSDMKSPSIMRPPQSGAADSTSSSPAASRDPGSRSKVNGANASSVPNENGATIS